MKAILIKERDYYDLYRIDEDGKRVTFASTEDYKQKLSKQNCDEIFGVVDVEKLADSIFEKESSNMLHPQYQMRNTFILGFNKAMELYQPIEIEVEIEMGDTPIWEDADVQGHVVCKKCGEWLESQIKPYKCKCINKPKLDSEGCLILKRVV